MTVFITCWEKKISKKGGKKIKKESKRINLNSEGLGGFFCCFYKFLPRSEDDTDPDSCGFFLPLGLTGSIAHILGKWMVLGMRSQVTSSNQPRGGSAPSFWGKVKPFLGSLPQGYPNPQGEGWSWGRAENNQKKDLEQPGKCNWALFVCLKGDQFRRGVNPEECAVHSFRYFREKKNEVFWMWGPGSWEMASSAATFISRPWDITSNHTPAGFPSIRRDGILVTIPWDSEGKHWNKKII